LRHRCSEQQRDAHRTSLHLTRPERRHRRAGDRTREIALVRLRLRTVERIQIIRMLQATCPRGERQLQIGDNASLVPRTTWKSLQIADFCAGILPRSNRLFSRDFGRRAA
jgi:hypothetical protein